MAFRKSKVDEKVNAESVKWENKWNKSAENINFPSRAVLACPLQSHSFRI